MGCDGGSSSDGSCAGMRDPRPDYDPGALLDAKPSDLSKVNPKTGSRSFLPRLREEGCGTALCDRSRKDVQLSFATGGELPQKNGLEVR